MWLAQVTTGKWQGWDLNRGLLCAMLYMTYDLGHVYPWGPQPPGFTCFTSSKEDVPQGPPSLGQWGDWTLTSLCPELHPSHGPSTASGSQEMVTSYSSIQMTELVGDPQISGQDLEYLRKGHDLRPGGVSGKFSRGSNTRLDGPPGLAHLAI